MSGIDLPWAGQGLIAQILQQVFLNRQETDTDCKLKERWFIILWGVSYTVIMFQCVFLGYSVAAQLIWILKSHLKCMNSIALLVHSA